ncbi:16S rRNA (cytidine(1402)-2'-O)-methyltransferase [Sphingomicrobium aestuariivivum]|uniref:16S rRNA (cytidine(1402)-2'-O)-methyltransferase n=1 Tax=Sphingomicrobium aestuariivivum TaxID=1582356 RepID=UPI001FD6563C|nr:16S rRNA (cytidine(1402)-2'-O)-methyltransferase [Sphingomicrobium aestuariivivum]MCJ8190259.1 16S rRNA (cytidine(1402)-2'-O)-methyltransferase [Sphingomicrobium aestuariivivum]
MANLELHAGLYIVATPIGNLSDISPRAAATIEAADLLLVEDSRVTGKLLGHLGLKKPMRPYHDHSKDSDREAILSQLSDKVVVLVSDAGTPLISDPGYKLVHEARARGLHVGAVPGPSAPTMALTLSGLPTDRFLFAGFIPNKDKARADLFEEFRGLRATLVFFETGPRLAKSLAAAAEVLGNRPAAVARELTKMFEEVATGTLTELTERYAETPPKGEIVLVIGPPGEADAPSEEDVDAAIDAALAEMSASRAAKDVAARFGLKKNDVYARVQERMKR